MKLTNCRLSDELHRVALKVAASVVADLLESLSTDLAARFFLNSSRSYLHFQFPRA